MCPVCKAECSVPTIVPIYVREEIKKEAIDDDVNDIGVDDIDDIDDVDDSDGALEEEMQIQSTQETPLNDSTGLRRRKKPQENTTISSNTDETTSQTTSSNFNVPINTGTSSHVPNRPQPPPAPEPAPASPSNSSSTNDNGDNNRMMDARSPHNGNHNALFQSLYGTLMGLQAEHAAASQQLSHSQRRNEIPSLHNRNHNGNSLGDEYHDMDMNMNGPGARLIEDATTELLSRILLMVGSFVILCLLVF